MATCKDCGGAIDWGQVDGAWRQFVPGTTDEHLMVCDSPKARRVRVRLGLEPGIFPVSASRIELYETTLGGCPLAYKRRYLDKIPEEQNSAGVLGRSLHQLQAALLQGKEPPTPVIPLKLYDDWAYLSRVMAGIQWDTRDAAFEDRLTYGWQDGAMTVECECVLDFWRVEESTTGIITDWKSGWAIEDEKELKTDVQANIYNLVVRRTLPWLEKVRFQQVQLRHGGATISVEFSADDADAFELALRAQVGRMIRDTDFQPNPYCTRCPAGTHPRIDYPVQVDTDGEFVIAAPSTGEEAERLAAFTFAAHRLAAAGKDALKPWCDENGSVGGYGHHEIYERTLAAAVERPDPISGEMQTVWGILRALEIVEERGWAQLVPELFKLDGTKLRAILQSTKKYAELAIALEPLITVSVDTKFDHKNEPKKALPVPAIEGGS
ncbi:MAG TPA: PD-(D/E)XK nuclease family protein [Candidatus Dormibacteraeota bacterium]|nr:PD-(D/E)XK nuclease family protein [Candidatus Dormibacteraeota bacterium]